MRAGKLVTGDEIVLKAIRSSEAKLVIVAGDASANTQKKFHDKCGTYKVPLVIGFDRDSLGSSIGKDTACCSCSYGSRVCENDLQASRYNVGGGVY